MRKHVIAGLLSVMAVGSTARADLFASNWFPAGETARRLVALPARIGGRTPCASLPRPVVRARLSVASDVVRDEAAIIREIIAAIWAREGITLEWIRGGNAPTWDDVDLWIVAQDGAVQNHQVDPALGAATFVRGIPQPLIRLSVGAAIDWVQQAVQRKLHIVAPFRRTFSLYLDNARVKVARTLGYAAAHEVGHVLLATRGHASSGLMSAVYTSLERLDADPFAVTLDRQSRERLAAAIARTAECAASQR
jgi:hypothetical protein